MTRLSFTRRLLLSPPWRSTAAATLTAIAIAPASAHAQTTTANLRGHLTTAGGPAVGATVTARYVENNQTRGTVSNNDGFYYLAGLRPGRYEVTVRRVGLAPVTRTVSLPIAQTVDLDLALGEAAVQLSTVQVQAVGGTTARTSEVGTSISRQQIADLPNWERNVLDLAKLAPGMTAPSSPASTDKVFAAGGQPPDAVNVFLDGATYKNDVLRGGVAGQDASKGNPFPQGAIQEFRVLTQNYKAEYQKAASAIIVATTRTGGNEVEADAFASGVGKSYTARDAFAERKGFARPNYDRLQAGGSLGAPIVHDRLFFFGTYELNFRDDPAYIFFGGDSSKAPASLLQSLRGRLGQQQQQFREHLGYGKLTFNQSERSTMDLGVDIRRDQDFRGFGGQTAFDAAENMKVNVTSAVGNWKYAGDHWLNEFQVNGQDFTWAPTWKNANAIGQNYFGVLRIGGKDTEQDFNQKRLSFRNDVTRSGVQLAGDHVFKGGASVDFLTYQGTKYQLGNPVFNYRVDENYQQPFEAQFGFGDPTITRANTQFGAFLQDDWTVTRKLTLNLGIRWDGETNGINNTYVTPTALADSLRGPLASQFYVDQPLPDGTTRRRNVLNELGGIDRFISNGRSSRPMYKKAFQPRVGASYDLMGDGRTVLFGGAGLYYDRNYWNTLFDEQFRRQFKVETVEFRNSCTAPGSPSNCVVWDPKYYDPATLRTLSGSAGRPEVFLVANDLVPPSTLQTSLGVRQNVGFGLLTVSYNGLRGRNYMNFIRATPWGGLGPNYAQAFISDDRVKTFFDALELQFERPMRGDSRWGGSLAYTLGKSREQGQSTDLFWGFDDRYSTVGDRPILRAPGDQRHNVVINGVFRLPYDIRFSSIVNLASGVTINGTNASAGWGPYQQFTYVYQQPERSFLGLGHVFGTENMDFRLEKDVATGRGQQIGILADVFNVFNSANFGCYDATIAPVASPNANYGRPGCAAPGRRLQIGIRYGLQPRSSSSRE